MSDHVTVEFDRYPWEPSSASRLVEELDHWNRPTAGVLEQDGDRFLFRVLDNTDAGPDVWVYAPLEHHEAAELAAASTPTQLRELVKKAFEGRPLVAVLTDADSRIRVAAVLDPLAEANEDLLLAAAVRELGQRLGPLLDDVKRDATLAAGFTQELTRLG